MPESFDEWMSGIPYADAGTLDFPKSWSMTHNPARSHSDGGVRWLAFDVNMGSFRLGMGPLTSGSMEEVTTANY